MPLPILSVAQMREWEQATWASGVSEESVIERVGRAVCDWVEVRLDLSQFILLLAGKGNNGADVKAAAKRLGYSCVQIKDPKKDLSKLKNALEDEPDVIIDGLFGIGLNRPLDQAWCRVIELINGAGAEVIAMDVPSGLSAETGEPMGAAVRANTTLTVGAPKRGLLLGQARDYTGALEVLSDVGLIEPCPVTTELHWSGPEDFREYPPPRAAASHKGTFGHLGIVAGSVGYSGAASLAARGAQRARPGLITVFTSPEVWPIVAGQQMAVMVTHWQDRRPVPGEIHTALLAGPGMAAASLPEEIRHWVRAWWKTAPVPVVVDASALDWLEPGPVASPAPRVITPHPGEAGRLLGCSAAEVQADRLTALRALSAKYGEAWVVLKGQGTLVGRQSGRVCLNSSGGPELAQGGSGDVLAGYLAGLLAQETLQQDPETAIRYAVWQHGATADELSKRRRAWVIEDLAWALGEAVPGSTERGAFNRFAAA